MSKWKDLAKGGWHPKEEKGTSLRGDFRGVNQVAGWVGKGKDPNSIRGNSSSTGTEHSSAPLSTLKDPASFGPPPKHVAIHGPQAGPGALPGITGSSRAPAPSADPQQTALNSNTEDAQATERPGLCRANTTGINLTTLPRPPARYENTQGAQPALDNGAGSTQPAVKPRLPPRLPARPHPGERSPPPPPSYDAATKVGTPGYINTSATESLGRSGISVPGFNIGGSGRSTPSFGATDDTDATSAARETPSTVTASQMGGLQSRFGRLGKGGSTPSTPGSASPPPTTGGTTWAQKQSALRTMSQAHSDPSRISLSEAKDAATTANSFRERHGAQVARGARTVNGLNSKYEVSGRLGSLGDGRSARQDSDPSSPPPVASSPNLATAKKAAPPPPPPKKRLVVPSGDVSAEQSSTQVDAPPPVPMSSKPR